MPRYIEAYGQTIEFPDGMDDAAIEAAIKRGAMDIPRQQAPKGTGGSMVGNLGMGLLRGAKDVIDTGADYLSRLGPAGENERVKAMNAQGKAEFDQGYGGSTAASLGRIGGNIAATLPVGGALGYGIRAAAPLAGGAAPIVSSLGNAIATGGMTTGNTLAPAANMAARIAGGGISGGLSAGLVDPASAQTGAMIGAALPPVIKGAGMLGSAARRGVMGAPVSPEVAQLASRAKELGINVPADRIADSKPLNALAASLNYVPMSGRSGVEEAMNAQLNKALSQTFGQDTSNITKGLRDASSKLGGEFDRVLKSNAVRVDDQFLNELAESSSRASRELGSDGAGIIGRQVDDIVAKAQNGVIDGQAAYNIKRTLDRIGQRNTPEAFYANDLKKGLMGALNRSLGPDEAAKFSQTRSQYGAMLDLEKIAKNGAEGEISVARLANMRNINNPQMQELADIAAQFVKPREGAHGSAQRVFGSLGSAGLGAGLIGGVPGAAAGLGASVALGRGANSLLNSELGRRAVLGQGLLSAPAPVSGLLGSGLYRGAPILGVDQ